MDGGNNTPQLCEFIKSVYEDIRNIEDGTVANYIPQLAKVNPDIFGISVYDVNGNSCNVGDTDIKFCLQSCCKPILYCIARDQLDYETVHKYVGREPSGQKFNAFILDSENKPHNPMINAGAIMISSLIKPNYEPSERFDLIKDYLTEMTGHMGHFGFDNSVFLSERRHASRNNALAYFMQEHNAFPKEPKETNINETLDFYFQNCSIESDCQSMAMIAATLANGGMCPINNQQVFERDTVRDCLSLMYGCGMYDYSGTFAFEIGLPAKSGVSGCLMLIVPNEMGICIWSPRLDGCGNSVKGLEFCRRFIKQYPSFHIFNNLTKKVENTKKLEENGCNLTIQFITAASNGELENVKKMLDKVDINSPDYDKRTALHLACSNGHFEVVEFLVSKGADPEVKDRWGNTPFHEANIHEESDPNTYEKIMNYLENV